MAPNGAPPRGIATQAVDETMNGRGCDIDSEAASGQLSQNGKSVRRKALKQKLRCPERKMLRLLLGLSILTTLATAANIRVEAGGSIVLEGGGGEDGDSGDHGARIAALESLLTTVQADNERLKKRVTALEGGLTIVGEGVLPVSPPAPLHPPSPPATPLAWLHWAHFENSDAAGASGPESCAGCIAVTDIAAASMGTTISGPSGFESNFALSCADAESHAGVDEGDTSQGVLMKVVLRDSADGTAATVVRDRASKLGAGLLRSRDSPHPSRLYTR